MGEPLKWGGALSKHDGGRVNIGGKAVKLWWEGESQSTTEGRRMESLSDESEPKRRD